MRANVEMRLHWQEICSRFAAKDQGLTFEEYCIIMASKPGALSVSSPTPSQQTP
jgi:hypothetical protein